MNARMLKVYFLFLLVAVLIACSSTPPPPQTPLEAAEAAVRSTPTPEAYVELSLKYWEAGRFQESINAAREALKLRPDYALAYNNIAASYGGMGNWDEALKAAEEAVRLDPNLQIARNNVAWFSTKKKEAEASRAQK